MPPTTDRVEDRIRAGEHDQVELDGHDVFPCSMDELSKQQKQTRTWRLLWFFIALGSLGVLLSLVDSALEGSWRRAGLLSALLIYLAGSSVYLRHERAKMLAAQAPGGSDAEADHSAG